MYISIYNSDLRNVSPPIEFMVYKQGTFKECKPCLNSFGEPSSCYSNLQRLKDECPPDNLHDLAHITIHKVIPAEE